MRLGDRSVAPLLFAALVAAVPSRAGAQDSTLEMTAERFEATLDYQTGRVTLHKGVATVDVPPSFRFLDSDGAAKLLVEGWGNPPGSGENVLGMLVPAGVSPLAAEGWGVVITFDEDGYVDDKDAESIDYAKLLRDMQKGTAAENEERAEAGYPAISLIGWAAPPSYNKETHKLYWAKELKVADATDHTLNYNIRVLGRRGVLVLNAVANMSQLAAIEQDMQQVLSFVEFNDGHRYADFVRGEDKVAEYGIAGLVVGAMAAKAGFFKVLLTGLLAAKKFLIAGAIAAFAFGRRFFSRRKESAA